MSTDQCLVYCCFNSPWLYSHCSCPWQGKRRPWWECVPAATMRCDPRMTSDSGLWWSEGVKHSSGYHAPQCELWRLRRSTNSIGYILCHVNKRFYIIGSSVFIHVHFKEVDTLYQINDVFLNCNFWKANGLQGWTLQWKSEATVV